MRHERQDERQSTYQATFLRSPFTSAHMVKAKTDSQKLAQSATNEPVGPSSVGWDEQI